MTSDAGAFGECLRGFRAAAGLSQEELAGRSGVSVRAIGDMERGRTRWPHRDSVRLLADALGLAGQEREEFLALTRRPAEGPAAEPGPEPVIVPYRGLSAFGERDAGLFFGREDATARVLALMPAGLVVVSGVSGAGKSSLLHAGVLSRLRQDGLTGAPEAAAWPCLAFTPGPNPLAELAVRIAPLAGVDAAVLRQQLADSPAGFALTARQAALAAPAGPADGGQRRVVLVVDQCEQLFTVCESARQREAFLTALHAAARDGTGQGPGALVVLVVRADFEARLADYPLLNPAVQDRYLLTAMTRRQMRLAITGPAAAAGASVEDDLVQVLLEEAGARPGGAGGLPLLSHALDQAWRTRAGRELTLADYERAGGIEGAVAASAQRAYQALTTAQQEIARQVFTRLGAISTDGTDTAVPAARTDLTAGKSPAQVTDVETVLERFAAERLLTLDAGTVTISHEVLLTAWPLLRDDWLADARADRAARTRLHAAAAEWVHDSRDPSWLYRGTRLEIAEGTAARIAADPRQAPLSPAEEGFLAASRRAARRRARTRQQLVAALLALVAALTTVWIMAVRAGHAASAQRDIALSRLLIGQSAKLSSTDATTSRLDALAAYALDQSAQAHYALLSAAANPQTATIPVGPAGDVTVALSPDGKILATGQSDDLVQLWDVASGQQLGKPISAVPSPAGRRPRSGNGQTGVVFVAFSPDGKKLAMTNSDGVQLWDVATRQRDGKPITAHGGTDAAAFSPDGRLLAVSGPLGVQLWDVATRQPDGNPIDTPGNVQMAFSPDGALLATAGVNGTRLWDLATRQPYGKPIATPDAGSFSVAFSPDSKLLATAESDGVRLWDVTTGQPAGKSLAGPGFVLAVAFSPDGKLLATGGLDGTGLWDVRTGRQVGKPLTENDPNEFGTVAFSADGRLLATGSPDGTARLWDVAATTFSRQFSPPDGSINRPQELPQTQVAFSADGKELAIANLAEITGPPLTRAWILDAATGRQTGRSLNTGTSTTALAFTPGGAILAASTASGVRVQGIATGQPTGKTFAALPHMISVRLSSDGKTLATITADGTVQLRDLATSRQTGRVSAGRSPGAEFSPDLGTMAVRGSNSITLWDTATGRQIGTPLPVPSTYFGPIMVFSPGSKTLAVLGDNGITLWDVATSRQTGQIPGVNLSVDAAAFSPDGKTLATGSLDGITRLWDLADGQQIGQDLTAGSESVGAVAFSPDGKTLATSSGDGTTWLWNVSYLSDPVKQLCARAGGSLTPANWARYVQASTPYRNVCPPTGTTRPEGAARR